MNKKVILICSTILLFVAIILVSVNITTIDVQGNKWYTDEQLEDLIFTDNISRNSTYCFLKKVLKEKKSIPFVEDYKIDFISPTKVDIIVYEKSIVGYLSYMSSYMYFDKDGIIVESSNKKLDGIPWITGVNFGQIVLYQKLPVEDASIFDNILNLTQILSLNDIVVDRIKYNSSDEATLIIGDIEVVLGDSSNMNGKIADLNDMLPKLSGLSGTLYLDTFDPNNEDEIYTFQKNDK